MDREADHRGADHREADHRGADHRGAVALDGPMMLSLTAVAAVGVTLSLIALGGWGWGPSMGVATGALLATVNLYLLALVSQGVIAGGNHGKLWGLAGGVKFLALLGLAFVLLRSGLASGLTLALGYGALPVGVTLGMLLGRPSKESVQRGA